MRLAFTADPPGCPALQVLVREVAMEELNEIIDVLFQINTAAPLAPPAPAACSPSFGGGVSALTADRVRAAHAACLIPGLLPSAWRFPLLIPCLPSAQVPARSALRPLAGRASASPEGWEGWRERRGERKERERV